MGILLKGEEASIIIAIIFLVGTPMEAGSSVTVNFIHWCLSMIGLAMIAVFATVQFECAICADYEHRHFNNADDSGVTNYRILIFYVIGCVALAVEILLYFRLKKLDIFL